MLRLFIAVIIAVGISSCGKEQKQEMGKVNVGDVAPDFELKDKDGNKIATRILKRLVPR